jgi:integrase
MLVQHDFTALFTKFITATRNGKRCKKNGEKVNPATVKNYENTLRILFEYAKHFSLQLYELKGNNKKDFEKAKRYNKMFYKTFCEFLSKKHGAVNNYTGHNIKIIRIFLNWCNQELGINTGGFHKNFYVLNEEIPIVTLSIEQLNHLIYSKAFEAMLPLTHQRAKDVFVFGCATGLRISDLRRLKSQHIIYRDGFTYVNISTQKVGYETLIKLPPFCLDIITKYKGKEKKLLPLALDSRFNTRIRDICEKAGWTWQLPKYRKIGSKRVEIKLDNKQYRFCDMVSSHTMRRTCITNMLYSGMPEHVVRKISGHAGNSKSFFRYVELAQKLVDQEINKLFDRLQPAPENHPELPV